MTKFTIIVPIYNRERYLHQCLESIIEQSYTDYEVILVDDGSTDSSAQICMEYVKKDQRFRYYQKCHSGSASARDFGLTYVTGEFVCFVDSDDVIEAQLLEVMNGLLKEKRADIYIYKYDCLREKPELDSYVPEMEEGFFSYISGQERFQLLMELLQFRYTYGVVNKLYRTELIKKYGVRFAEGICMGEDLGFNLQYFLHCNTICVINQNLYWYRVHENSIMTFGKRREPRLDEFVVMLKSVEEHYKLYADVYIKKNFMILHYEGMRNQYVLGSRKEIIQYIQKMQYRKEYYRMLLRVFCSVGQLVKYYGYRKAWKILKENVRYFFGV